MSARGRDRRGLLAAQRSADRGHPAVQRRRRRRGVRPRPAGAGGLGADVDRRARGRAAALHDLVLDRQDEISTWSCSSPGKARKDAYRRAGPPRPDGPLLRPDRARAPRHPPRGWASCPALTRVEINRVPKGVVGIISPWNYPLTMAAVRRAAGAARGQRRGHQARRPDDALRAARRSAARRGRLAPRACGRSSPVTGRELGTPMIERRRLHLLHRLDRDRQADRRPVRRAADRVLARARWQEPDARPARRQPREGGRGRRTRVVLQRRTALRLDGADVRRRPGLRPVRRALRRPHRGDERWAPRSSGASTWAR